MMKEGWEYRKLGEVCIIERGGSPRPIKDYITDDSNGLNWIKIGDTDPQGKYIYSTKEKIKPAGLKKSRWVEVNDFLLSNSMSFGRPYILKTNGCIHDGWLVLRKYQQYLNADFFYYLLLSSHVQKQFERKAQGSTVSNLNTQRVSSVEITFPPLPEQHRIVEYLDTQFAKIDALKTNAEQQLQAAKDLFQSALKDLMTPKEGWEENYLGNISNIYGRIGFRGYTTKDMVSGPNEGAITLSPSNIQNGSMDYTKCQYISLYKYNESPEIMIQNGDVLIVKTGSSYGKSALVENLPHKATINPQLVVVKNIKIDNRFFAYLIRTPWVQNEINNFVAGTAIPTFSQANLSKVLLRFPKSIEEQQQIAARLDELSANIKSLQSNYEQTLTLCNDLKQSLLKKIFE